MNEYDVAIIGGGATGLGVAVEAASRGYKTILFEAYDYGKGTSSKSTKLVHGGIRYLANFDFELVREGLNERYFFLKNASHIAKSQPYMVPLYSWLDKLKYFVGIKLYDFLAGKQKIGASQFLNKDDTLEYAPHLNQEGLKGSAVYYDGQFDDTRMLIALLRTFENLGGIAKNYTKVTGFIKDSEYKVTGLKVIDKLNNENYEIKAKVVINATGTLTDTILDIDEPVEEHKHVAAAQGTHLVFKRDIFDSKYALVIPKTIDDRILFVLPWLNHVVVGTTDIAIDKPEIDPIAQNNEINFILDTLNNYTNKTVTREDIKSVFAGQRPLVRPANQTNSAKISRKHEILFSQSGLISIVGGKWTIYRLMGEDTINFAISKGLLVSSKSVSKELKLFAHTDEIPPYPLSVYGSEADKILEIQKEIDNDAKLHPHLPYLCAEVIYQVRYEQAKTVEDVLARRTRALLLNAKAAIDAAPVVARLMATEMGYGAKWIKAQLDNFNEIARQYLPS
jgi:glycerol-3-phosphate dehydrogenase